MRPTDLLPPDVATALEDELPASASGARVAEWLAEAHRMGRIGTSQLCEAVGALEVELPEGVGTDDPVVLALIGRGAMGEVHLARDDRLARHVAIKRVTLGGSSGPLRAQFTAEARILAQLDHPSIPPIYDVESGPEGIEAYSMKLVRGRTLDQLLDEAREARQRGERLDEDHDLAARLDVFVKVCDAVHYAHTRGVLHRDLKPANIMVGTHGEVLVLDWGIAHLIGEGRQQAVTGPASSSDATVMGKATGTPAYMSPEQANGALGSLDARSDEYALGLLLHELISLERAVSGVTEIALERASRGERDPLRHAFGDAVPRELVAIVRKATRLDRRSRYPTVDAMAEDVRRFLRDEPILAEPDGAWQGAKRWVGRHRAATLALLLSAMLAIVLTLGLATVATGSVVGLVWWRAAVHQEALAAVVASVSSHARRIDATFQGYQGLLTGLAFAAETGLRDHPPADVAVVHPDELVPTGAVVVAPGYDGTEISTQHAVVWISPGVSPASVEEPARQLAALQPELMRVVYGSAPTDLPTEAERASRVVESGLPVVWAYVVHRDGLMVVWPGAPDYPADYEPRDQEWYASAQGRRRPQWDPASRDPSDTEDVGLLVTASVGVWDGDDQIGVAALDVAIDHVLDELLAPPGVQGDVDTWLVDDAGRTIATSVARDAEPPPFPYPDVLATVRSGREAGTQERGGRVVAWARLDALRWTYVVVGPLAALSGG